LNDFERKIVAEIAAW